jgi:L-ascorbate metabolism protein UlaG (beta-lactamase superfamily)
MKKTLITLWCLCLLASSTLCAESPKVTIHFGGGQLLTGDFQTEILCPNGTRILVDAFDANRLTSPVTKDDILLTTRTRNDELVKNFPGEKLQARVGEINRPGLYIRGIASSNLSNNLFMEEGGTNYIYLIETAGIRIAHFGYIGQNQLSPDQLKALGVVDIALTPFYNFSSQMDAYNRKAFRLMEQVKPKMVIPFDVDPETVRYAAEIWQSLYRDEPSITLSAEKLPRQTQVIYLGPDFKPYAKISKAVKADY